MRKTLRLNSITAAISMQDDAEYDLEKTKKINCPNQISTKDWTTSELLDKAKKEMDVTEKNIAFLEKEINAILKDLQTVDQDIKNLLAGTRGITPPPTKPYKDYLNALLSQKRSLRTAYNTYLTNLKSYASKVEKTASLRALQALVFPKLRLPVLRPLTVVADPRIKLREQIANR